MSIRSWLVTAIALAISASLAFAYLPFPNLSLEHLSSPYVKVIRLGDSPGHGSGTYLGRGFILTANHVIRYQDEFEILTEDGKTFPATVVSQDIGADTAILAIDPLAAMEAVSVDCAIPRNGTEVRVIGNPYDLEFIRFRGFVAGKPRSIEIGSITLPAAMVLDITVTPGVSGASVRNLAGKIIGIITATLNIGNTPLPVVLAVPSSAFCPLLKQAGAL